MPDGSDEAGSRVVRPPRAAFPLAGMLFSDRLRAFAAKVDEEADALRRRREPPPAPPAPSPAAEAGVRPAARPACASGVDPSLAARLGEGVGKPPEELARESQRRTAYITGYLAELKQPTGNPDYASQALVFQAIAEERGYQQGMIVELVAALRALPPPAGAFGLSPEEAEAHPEFRGLESRRAELDQRLAAAQRRQTQMYQLMKRIAGVTGKTGGTDFLAEPEAKQPDYTRGVVDLDLKLDMRG